MMNELTKYPFEIRPIVQDDGGGFLIRYPDFNTCIADGETPEEAMKNGLEALQATIAALKAEGLPIPKPDSSNVCSGRFVTRIPKSIHRELTLKAKQEGVSLNTLVLSLIARGLGDGRPSI
jgi:antitoxin HicB